MEINYFFARLNVAATQDLFNDTKTKYDVLLESMGKGSSIEFRECRYRFTDVEVISPAREKFITGYLVKYREETLVEVVNEKTGKIENETVEEKVISKVRFFIHTSSSMIMFHESGNIISKTLFKNIFEMLFINSMQYGFSADIVFISETFKFLKELEKFESVKRIRIDLVPPNPHNAPRWEKIGIRLQNLKATNYTEIIETKKEKGTIGIDDQIKDKIAMAEDGYGVGSATGVEDGIERTITTVRRQNAVKAKAPVSTNPEEIVGGLKGRLEQLLKRFKE